MSTTDVIEARSLKVYNGGRITVPQQKRREMDDMIATVEFRIETEDSDDAAFIDHLDTRGRVYIPARIRDRYGVEDGDYVDVEVHE